MNKFLVLPVFYGASAVLLFFLDKFFPAAGHDGGWSLAALVVVLLSIAVLVWFVVSLIKGFTKNKSYLLVALVHLIVLAIVAKKVFGLY